MQWYAAVSVCERNIYRKSLWGSVTACVKANNCSARIQLIKINLNIFFCCFFLYSIHTLRWRTQCAYEGNGIIFIEPKPHTNTMRKRKKPDRAKFVESIVFENAYAHSVTVSTVATCTVFTSTNVQWHTSDGHAVDGKMDGNKNRIKLFFPQRNLEILPILINRRAIQWHIFLFVHSRYVRARTRLRRDVEKQTGWCALVLNRPRISSLLEKNGRSTVGMALQAIVLVGWCARNAKTESE